MKRNSIKVLDNGSKEYSEIDLYKKLNFEFLRYTNLTHAAGKRNLPSLVCNTKIFPDYIALSNQPSLFHKTELTAIGFWEYDIDFDGFDGLFNAIYYNRKDRLEFYKKRFSNVKIFFTPDYSQFGDVSDIESDYRLFKARVVGIWLAIELHAVVIPFVTVPTIDSMPWALNGLEDCSVVAFSTKGYVTVPEERSTLKAIVRCTVDTLDLKTIVVYDVCGSNDAVNDIFAYPIEQGIEIVVPMNSLKERNIERRRFRNAQ